MKAFCCWSGGKDSSLVCYKMMQNRFLEETRFSDVDRFIRSTGKRPSEIG